MFYPPDYSRAKNFEHMALDIEVSFLSLMFFPRYKEQVQAHLIMRYKYI